MKNQNGITLIALVITIIVLLILAGISIAMLTGDNGILKKANDATTATGKAEAEEAVKLALATILANKNDPTYGGTENTVTFSNIQSVVAKDNNSAVLTDESAESSTDIVIKYKASSTAKQEYTVTVDSTTGKIK